MRFLWTCPAQPHEKWLGIVRRCGLSIALPGASIGPVTALLSLPMMQTFEAALQSRADAMADACTRCGKCAEVCPATEAAGLTVEQRQDPVHVIDGIIDIVRHGEGNEAARKWASGCLLSGECIKACDYGVNPRFLLYMARVEMAHG